MGVMKFRPRRNPADFAATIRTELGNFPAEISDVSEKGVRLQMPKGVYAMEPEVKVIIQGTPYPATVVWQQNGCLGAEFKHKLQPSAVAAVLRKLGRAKPEKKRRFLMS